MRRVSNCLFLDSASSLLASSSSISLTGSITGSIYAIFACLENCVINYCLRILIVIQYSSEQAMKTGAAVNGLLGFKKCSQIFKCFLLLQGVQCLDRISSGTGRIKRRLNMFKVDSINIAEDNGSELNTFIRVTE